MKAFAVTSVFDESCTHVVFADNRTAAIKYALENCKGDFEGISYINMRAHREPKLDMFENEKRELRWDDMNDRAVMVKEAGYTCGDEIGIKLERCEEQCAAYEWCKRYQHLKEIWK